MNPKDINCHNDTVVKVTTVIGNTPWPEGVCTSSEGERLMLETLVESTGRGRRIVLQYITMLSVIALPVAAVICLVSYTLYNSRVEREDPLVVVVVVVAVVVVVDVVVADCISCLYLLVADVCI